METLNIFKARSTWVMIFTVIANIIFLFTGELPFAPEEASDKVILVVDALAAAWIYFERVTGKMKLINPFSKDTNI